MQTKTAPLAFAALVGLLASCAPQVIGTSYRDPNMDFGALQAVAVLPFQNLSRDTMAAERVRDVFVTSLLSTGAVYVLPVGEVARGVARAEIQAPATPSADDVKKLAGAIKVQAVITGVVKEYGEVRSGANTSGIVSISVQMLEAQTGKAVWTATSTKGGIGIADRLFGGGGRPMNDITRDAVNDVIRQLFQ